LGSGDVFIDIGANIGYYSVLVGKIIGNSGQIISMEPIPYTANILKYNIKLNNLRNIKVIQKAAWSRTEIITLHVPKSLFGRSTVSNLHSTDLITVEGIPLDSICSPKEIKLLKIDAEGSEYQILKGSRKTLKKMKCIILEASKKRDKIIDLLNEEQFNIQEMKFTTYLYAYKKEKG
jgi:FkbM family methyltransferase